MNLAIQGHSNRGNEVISYLEMLGGKNPYGCNGLGTLCAYYIIDGNIQIVTIEDLFKSNEYILYSLEGILTKFPYKVGDKVIYEDKIRKITKMVWEAQTNTVAYKLDDKLYCNVINELQPYKEETTEKVKDNWAKWDLPDGYEFQDKDGNIINTNVIKLVKKQPKYPKTYEECCKILDFCGEYFFTTYDSGNYVLTYPENDNISKIQQILKYTSTLTKLIICRTAYWKIAGDELGLGKPWEPNWENLNEYKYGLFRLKNIIYKNATCINPALLIFPTPEMRDAFYENFKELIEACKELL